MKENNSQNALNTLISAIGEKPASENLIEETPQTKDPEPETQVNDSEIHLVPPENYINEDDFPNDDDPALQSEEDISLGDILPPEACLAILNFLIPIMIVVIIKHIAGYSCKRKDFELTAAEKKIMEGPLKLFIRSIKVNIKDPAVLFGITLLAVYGSKVIDKWDEFEKIPKKKKREPSFGGDNFKDTVQDAVDKKKKKKEEAETIDL